MAKPPKSKVVEVKKTADLGHKVTKKPPQEKEAHKQMKKQTHLLKRFDANKSSLKELATLIKRGVVSIEDTVRLSEQRKAERLIKRKEKEYQKRLHTSAAHKQLMEVTS